MKKKEASARIKINRLLEEAGWRFFDAENGPANIQLEPNVKMSKADLTGLGENFDEVKNGFVDFLLLDDKGKPFIVLEAKAEDKDPLVGKEQAREYAKSFYLKYVILSNGNQHYFWNIYKGNPQLITAFPSYESIRESKAMNADPAKLYSEEINLKGELKKLVKERNDYAHANGRLLLTSEEFFLEKIRNFNHCIDRVFALIKDDILQLYSSTLNDPDFYDSDIRAYLYPTQQVQEEIVKKYSFSRFELNWCRKFNIKQLESRENYASKKELHIALSKYYKELKSEL